MNKPMSYDEVFWGPDFCSAAGFEALKKRVREGRATCKTVIEYLQKKQKAEEDLAKALAKAAKLSPDLQELGTTLRMALDSVRDETEKMANSHTELSNNIGVSVKRLSDFATRQKTENKQREEIVDKTLKNKIALFKSYNEAKKVYEKLSSEAEVAEVNLAKAKPNQAMLSTRDWEKLVNAQSKTKADAEKSQRAYEEAVRKLDAARSEWEHEMTEYCKLCEKQDQERYAVIQSELWTNMNATSTAAVEVDEECENVRRKLEGIDVNSDIQVFIATSRTGTERPAPLRFEPYKPQLSSSSGSGSLGRSENGAPSVERSATMRLPHSPLESSSAASTLGRGAYYPSNPPATVRSREGPVQVLNRSYLH